MNGLEDTYHSGQPSVNEQAPLESASDIKRKNKADAQDGSETLKEAIAKQVAEDDGFVLNSSTVTLRKILGGDILTSKVMRRQIWLILLIVFFLIIYISNRYSVQKDLIEIAALQDSLQNAKYRALSSNSLITEKSRESHVLELLKNNKDSTLKIASQPPYIINVPEE